MQCITIFTRLRGTRRGLSQYTLIRADLSRLNIIKLESRAYDMAVTWLRGLWAYESHPWRLCFPKRGGGRGHESHPWRLCFPKGGGGWGHESHKRRLCFPNKGWLARPRVSPMETMLSILVAGEATSLNPGDCAFQLLLTFYLLLLNFDHFYLLFAYLRTNTSSSLI